MAALEIDKVTVRLGGTTVLDDVCLGVERGEIVCITGPSGAGKSTLLRAVAGLVTPDSGTVRWDGRDLTGVSSHERGIGMMFQDYLLFPHRDVGANVAFGLRMQRRSKHETAERVAALLALVGLPGSERRAVATLSGGEQQRVALARALAPEPGLLLLDEPLGALDRELHQRLAIELRELLRNLGTTAVHVTHDRSEAELLGDRTVDLRDLASTKRPNPERPELPERP